MRRLSTDRMNLTPNIYFEDLGRPLEDKIWMTNFLESIGRIATRFDLKLSLRERPAITYVLGNEIKYASQIGRLAIDNPDSTNGLIQSLKQRGIVNERKAGFGIETSVSNISLKSLPNGNGPKEIRAIIKDIPTLRGFGGEIYEERRLVQAAIGLPYAVTEISRIFKPTTENTPRNPVLNLIIGTIATRNRLPLNIEVLEHLKQDLNNSRIVIGKLASYNAFASREL